MKSGIKKYAVAVGASALMAMALSSAVRAEDDRKFGYSITLTGVSDYLFRGISLTDEQPAFQPYLEFTYGIAYLGFWGSNIDDAGKFYGPWETDVYAGIRPVTGPVNWDLGVLYYTYGTGDAAEGAGLRWNDIDYVEFKVAATTSPMTNLTLGVTGYYTPDQSSAITETGTIEGSVNYTLPQFAMFTPTIGGGVGYTTSDTDLFFLGKEKDYVYWNAGVKLTVEKFFMDLRYWDTSIDDDQAELAVPVLGRRYAALSWRSWILNTIGTFRGPDSFRRRTARLPAAVLVETLTPKRPPILNGSRAVSFSAAAHL